MLLRSCAIWRENEREVTVMKQYILDTRMGTIQEEPIQGKMGWDGTENQQENTCLILAATLKEFETSSHSPGSITDPNYSIEVGVQTFADCISQAGCSSPQDMDKLKLA